MRGTFCVEFEHPSHGSARVFWRWVKRGRGYAAEPIAVEFDLFTPDSEAERLTELLRFSKLDRSSSVSALPEPGPLVREDTNESEALPF